ncbi:hypothetical protein FRB97_006085 [Tulasnella sp. 331]|nr:hypothetical protein FRB97_006085 [Tulasnella sp. 331]
MPQNNSDITRHFMLAAPMPAFGRLRPMTSIICKLVTMDASLVVTIVCLRPSVPMVNEEIARVPLPEDVTRRIRVIGMGQSEAPKPGSDTQKVLAEMLRTLPDDFLQIYETLVGAGSPTCTNTGVTFEYHDIPRISIALVDTMSPSIPATVKRVTPHVPIVSMWCSGVSSFIDYFAPAEYGGMSDFEALAKEAQKGGDTRALDQIFLDTLAPQNGSLRRGSNGLITYDYETMPQGMFPSRLPFPIPFYVQPLAGIQHVDAVLCHTTRGFESRSTEVLKQWWEVKLGRKMIFSGPQVPAPGSTKVAKISESSDIADPFKPIFTFLDSHPAKSVMLISFGSMFYPSEKPWIIESVLKTLLETRTPFIFSRAAFKSVPLSPELENFLADSDTALVAAYIPIKEALEHPSVGTFLTHGGANSMFESILAGVLDVFWPFTADQPVHAAYMSETVRTGVGAQPPYRGGKVEGTPDAVAAEMKHVLSDINSEVGERKRRNLEVVRHEMLEAMKKGGEAETELEKLLNLFSA